MIKVDQVTKYWTFNRSDELAAENGCYFDAEMGGYVVWWIERNCTLYEGERAGQPVRLMGCHECQDFKPDEDGYDPSIPDEFDPDLAAERAAQYIACRKKGHEVDWQYEATMRLFGWAKYSERWDRPIRRFRKASIWVPKKNKKTPTEAAWGCYLFVGDGEQGQNLFSVAKDGKQAKKLGHKHAERMIKKSELLSSEIKINKTTGDFWHEESESSWSILSGDNDLATEGINGSVMVDETHVVPAKLINRINRAGISRSEPLHIEVSTAGDNPDSYGKGRFDHGLQVAAGKIKQDNLLFICYSAPQDLTAEQLAKDPVKYGRMANPAWGHTIFEEEFLADYHESKQTITGLLLFMMYRLNIWQKGASPWLNTVKWNACYAEGIQEKLLGEMCWLGGDLSKTQDMSAIVLAFPWTVPDVYALLAWFWMTEDYAHANKDNAPFLEWADSGHLILTPGDVIDYNMISDQIRRLAEMFDIQEFIYDGTYANALFQNLEEGIYVNGEEVAPGLGIPRVDFKQNMASYAEPCDDFEARIREGKLVHSGHPVLDWMAGHVKAKHDAGGRMMPVKPKPHDVKKIDGIQASIMALAGAVAGYVNEPSFYHDNEMEMG